MLWKVPIGGGEPTQLTERFATEPDISPDGNFVACFSNDVETGKSVILVLQFTGGTPDKTFPLPSTLHWSSGPRWTPDGRAVTYIDGRGETTNVWLQPLSGGPAQQLSNFKEDGVSHREWSPDRKQIAIVRGSATSDAVIISNFQ